MKKLTYEIVQWEYSHKLGYLKCMIDNELLPQTILKNLIKDLTYVFEHYVKIFTSEKEG